MSESAEETLARLRQEEIDKVLIKMGLLTLEIAHAEHRVETAATRLGSTQSYRRGGLPVTKEAYGALERSLGRAHSQLSSVLAQHRHQMAEYHRLSAGGDLRLPDEAPTRPAKEST